MSNIILQIITGVGIEKLPTPQILPISWGKPRFIGDFSPVFNDGMHDPFCNLNSLLSRQQEMRRRIQTRGYTAHSVITGNKHGL